MEVRDRNSSPVKRVCVGSNPTLSVKTKVAQLVEHLEMPSQFSPLKFCPTCKNVKPLNEFNSQKTYCLECHRNRNTIWRQQNNEINKESQRKHNKKRRKKSSYRLLQKKYSKIHYQKNKIIYIEKAKIQKEKTSKIYQNRILEYLEKHPCIDCGEADPIVLTFDHVRGIKEFNISEIFRVQYSWKKIVIEIDKCEIRCCNCHMRKTSIERKFWKSQL